MAASPTFERLFGGAAAAPASPLASTRATSPGLASPTKASRLGLGGPSGGAGAALEKLFPRRGRPPAPAESGASECVSPGRRSRAAQPPSRARCGSPHTDDGGSPKAWAWPQRKVIPPRAEGLPYEVDAHAGSIHMCPNARNNLTHSALSPSTPSLASKDDYDGLVGHPAAAPDWSGVAFGRKAHPAAPECEADHLAEQSAEAGAAVPHERLMYYGGGRDRPFSPVLGMRQMRHIQERPAETPWREDAAPRAPVSLPVRVARSHGVLPEASLASEHLRAATPASPGPRHQSISEALQAGARPRRQPPGGQSPKAAPRWR